MKASTAALVYPVLAYGLEIKDRLANGEALSMAKEQAVLERLLRSETASWQTGVFDLDCRYILACWIDEIMIDGMVWSAEWNENKLEQLIHRSNDRAWKFWEEAAKAANRSDLDLLELCLICVALGFRGRLRNDPGEIAAWVEATKLQLRADRLSSWTNPPQLEPRVDVPPLRGRASLRRMTIVAGVAAVALLIAASALATTAITPVF